MAQRRRRASKSSSEATETVLRKVKVSSLPEGDEHSEERTVQIRDFETDPAYVRVNAGVTKNLGDFESLRIDVSVSCPCYKEDLEDTYEEVSEWVAGKLADEVDGYISGTEE